MPAASIHARFQGYSCREKDCNGPDPGSTCPVLMLTSLLGKNLSEPLIRGVFQKETERNNFRIHGFAT